MATKRTRAELFTGEDSFLTGKTPTEAKFRDFMASVPFFNEPGDLATDQVVGLVSIASNANAVAGTVVDGEVLQANHLPTVMAGNGITVTPTTSELGHNIYTITVDESEFSVILAAIEALNVRVTALEPV